MYILDVGVDYSNDPAKLLTLEGKVIAITDKKINNKKLDRVAISVIAFYHQTYIISPFHSFSNWGETLELFKFNKLSIIVPRLKRRLQLLHHHFFFLEGRKYIVLD